MKYGDFEKESKKTWYGKIIFKAWIDKGLPLSWAIDLFLIINNNKKNESKKLKKNSENFSEIEQEKEPMRWER